MLARKPRRRRWLELQQRGEETTLAEVIEAVQRRDHDDGHVPPPPYGSRRSYYIDQNLSIDDPSTLMVEKVKFFGISFRPPHPRPGE